MAVASKKTQEEIARFVKDEVEAVLSGRDDVVFNHATKQPRPDGSFVLTVVAVPKEKA